MRVKVLVSVDVNQKIWEECLGLMSVEELFELPYVMSVPAHTHVVKWYPINGYFEVLYDFPHLANKKIDVLMCIQKHLAEKFRNVGISNPVFDGLLDYDAEEVTVTLGLSDNGGQIAYQMFIEKHREELDSPEYKEEYGWPLWITKEYEAILKKAKDKKAAASQNEEVQIKNVANKYFENAVNAQDFLKGLQEYTNNAMFVNMGNFQNNHQIASPIFKKEKEYEFNGNVRDTLNDFSEFLGSELKHKLSEFKKYKFELKVWEV